jgi:cytochrome c biogenesis protein CcmG/thiol:disulfide interchange protein DsbE
MTEPQSPPPKPGLQPWAFIPLILLAVVVVAGAVVLTQGRERLLISDAVEGRPAPAYSLPALDAGEPVTPAAFEGRAYLINTFASWCVPCRAEHPQLMALAARGVPILGVAHKDAPEAAQAFLDQLGDPFTTVGLDPDGRFALELGVAGVPETFVVGPDGRLRAVYRGALTPEIVDSVILPALDAD